MDIRKEIEEKFFTKLRKSNYVGAEIEMPLINMKKPFKVEKEIIQKLFEMLVQNGFGITARDDDGNIISIKNKHKGDIISLEYSFNSLEFSLNKEHNIYHLKSKFNNYYMIISNFLKDYNYKLCDSGINPNYEYIDKKCLNQKRYRVIERLLVGERDNLFGHFCAYCCSIQTHINVSKRELVKVMNMFTEIEDIKDRLFANSYMKETKLKNSRKYLWENSNFGPLNVGRNKIYKSLREIKEDYLKRNMFFVKRENKFFLLKEKCSVEQFFMKSEVQVIDDNGREYSIVPEIQDFDNFRSYKSVELTKYGTLEVRTDCTQKLEDMFKLIAFNVGVSLCSSDILAYIIENKEITEEELLRFATVGLKKRGYGEEKLLEETR